MADAAGEHGVEAVVRRGIAGRPRVALGAVLLVAVALVGIAWWMTGPAPEPVDAGLPDAPPPLALPSDTPTDSPLARAAALLATQDLDGARAGFVSVVAESPEDVAGQVGLVLSRWRTTGPPSVEGDLRQLVAEYPESAFVQLHLGLVQSLLRTPREARESFRAAEELGREAADPTSLRMANLADDLLHPDAFRGPLPVLVPPAEVQPGQRPELRALLSAVEEGDRKEASRIAEALGRSGDDMARVAAVASSFDKDDVDAAAGRLDALAAEATLSAAARDRAALHASLARLWSGEERDAGCLRLERSTLASTDPGTRRIATPIHTELCN